MAFMEHSLDHPGLKFIVECCAGNWNRPLGDAFDRQRKYPGCDCFSCAEASIVFSLCSLDNV